MAKYIPDLVKVTARVETSTYYFSGAGGYEISYRLYYPAGNPIGTRQGPLFPAKVDGTWYPFWPIEDANHYITYDTFKAITNGMTMRYFSSQTVSPGGVNFSDWLPTREIGIYNTVVAFAETLSESNISGGGAIEPITMSLTDYTHPLDVYNIVFTAFVTMKLNPYWVDTSNDIAEVMDGIITKDISEILYKQEKLDQTVRRQLRDKEEVQEAINPRFEQNYKPAGYAKSIMGSANANDKNNVADKLRQIDKQQGVVKDSPFGKITETIQNVENPAWYDDMYKPVTIGQDPQYLLPAQKVVDEKGRVDIIPDYIINYEKYQNATAAQLDWLLADLYKRQRKITSKQGTALQENDSDKAKEFYQMNGYYSQFAEVYRERRDRLYRADGKAPLMQDLAGYLQSFFKTGTYYKGARTPTDQPFRDNSASAISLLPRDPHNAIHFQQGVQPRDLLNDTAVEAYINAPPEVKRQLIEFYYDLIGTGTNQHGSQNLDTIMELYNNASLSIDGKLLTDFKNVYQNVYYLLPQMSPALVTQLMGLGGVAFAPQLQALLRPLFVGVNGVIPQQVNNVIRNNIPNFLGGIAQYIADNNGVARGFFQNIAQNYRGLYQNPQFIAAGAQIAGMPQDQFAQGMLRFFGGAAAQGNANLVQNALGGQAVPLVIGNGQPVNVQNLLRGVIGAYMVNNPNVNAALANYGPIALAGIPVAGGLLQYGFQLYQNYQQYQEDNQVYRRWVGYQFVQAISKPETPYQMMLLDKLEEYTSRGKIFDAKNALGGPDQQQNRIDDANAKIYKLRSLTDTLAHQLETDLLQGTNQQLGVLQQKTISSSSEPLQFLVQQQTLPMDLIMYEKGFRYTPGASANIFTYSNGTSVFEPPTERFKQQFNKKFQETIADTLGKIVRDPTNVSTYFSNFIFNTLQQIATIEGSPIAMLKEKLETVIDKSVAYIQDNLRRQNIYVRPESFAFDKLEDEIDETIKRLPPQNQFEVKDYDVKNIMDSREIPHLKLIPLEQSAFTPRTAQFTSTYSYPSSSRKRVHKEYDYTSNKYKYQKYDECCKRDKTAYEKMRCRLKKLDQDSPNSHIISLNYPISQNSKASNYFKSKYKRMCLDNYQYQF